MYMDKRMKYNNKSFGVQILAALALFASVPSISHASSTITKNPNDGNKICLYGSGSNYVEEDYEKNTTTYVFQGKKVRPENRSLFSMGERKLRERTFTLDANGKIQSQVVVRKEFEICYRAKRLEFGGHDSTTTTTDMISLMAKIEDSELSKVGTKRCMYDGKNYAIKFTSSGRVRFVRGGLVVSSSKGYQLGAFKSNDFSGGSGVTDEEIVNTGSTAPKKRYEICMPPGVK